MEKLLDQSFLPARYFEEICAVPHGSSNEKPLSDYIVRFAQEHGLRYKQYPNFNVIVYKPASKGYEDKSPIMLQAHIDMVCEKAAGVEHNFKTDPLELYIENGFLHAKGTTLGADDGVGVAYMLSFLHDDSLPHPPLECVFTVQEEVGLIGSRDLDYSAISSRRMIGLDEMGGSTCYVSACGSQHMFLERSYEIEKISQPAFRLTVSGLIGGHSGVCINKERGNAIKIAARALYLLRTRFGIRIGAVSGGGKDNVIPTDCEAVFTTNADYGEVSAYAEQLNAMFGTELEFSDAGVKVAVEKAKCKTVLTEKDSDSFIDFAYLLPDGFRHRSMKIEHLTTVSENLANLQLHESRAKVRYFVRSELDSYLDQMAEEVKLLCGIFGYELDLENRAPGWKFEENSEMRRAVSEAYHAITGGELKPIAEHGGLELGYISGGLPGIDIATIGPYCDGYHTPNERLDLKSFRDTYEVLKYTLKNL